MAEASEGVNGTEGGRNAAAGAAAAGAGAAGAGAAGARAAGADL